jgi:hypothetical protein
MTAEIRVCKNCEKQFSVEPEDFDFYKNIDVPPPTWCPECRNIRRLSWREDRTFQKSICALCKKPTLSMYPPGGPFTIYCRDCWHSDRWDRTAYGRDYDFSKPFFLQYRELMESVPRPALTGTNLVNSEYTHGCESVKNCYSVFFAFETTDSQYGWVPLLSRNTVDTYGTDKSDHAYETLLSDRLYRSKFVYFSHNSLESSFLFDCVGCSDCFGCVNLRKKKYRFFNEQLSKEEYVKRIADWDLGSYAKLEEAKQKFREFYLSVPHRYADIVNSTNVTGDVIRDSKNCITCFSALEGVQNCKYVYFAALGIKDSYDVSAVGNLSELLYEASYTSQGQHVRFSSGGSNGIDTEYCEWAVNCANLFGCIALKNNKYCILNKQYSKEEYFALREKIIAHMNEMPYTQEMRNEKGDMRKIEYKYGEFFPAELSAHAYNDSLAFPWYPKTKEEALAEGLQWRDQVKHSHTITIQSENLPDHIRDVKDEILNETIGCLHNEKCAQGCTGAFRLTREELAFYRDMQVALPRLCPSCRHAERIKWRNGFRLWKRRCQCNGTSTTNNLQPTTDNRKGEYTNTALHAHGEKPCPNEFETTYAPERPEIVYCDACYKAEFL